MKTIYIYVIDADEDGIKLFSDQRYAIKWASEKLTTYLERKGLHINQVCIATDDDDTVIISGMHMRYVIRKIELHHSGETGLSWQP